jgi:DNA-binding NtrC family response regulator
MKPHLKILVVEDVPSLRESLKGLLGVYNDVDAVGDVASARVAIEKNAYDVVVLDKGLPEREGEEAKKDNGLALIPEIKADYPNIVVIVITIDNEYAPVRRAIDAGADDYVVKGQHIVADLLVRIPFAVERAAGRRDLSTLKQQLRGAFKYELLGRSQATEQLRLSLMGHQDSKAHVLILGESGSGKELIARRLHALADTGSRPFVTQNCAAIPDGLLESELFGHMKGAYSGAHANKAGKFELAHKGDIFLDEIGDLSLKSQAKLLRVLDDGEFFRLGGPRPLYTSCRVIAATNKDLPEMVRKGTFREDLYHRLAVVLIHTTPLRHRLEDIEDMAEMIRFQLDAPGFTISKHAFARLKTHDWPGNGRELRNVIERALLRARRRNSTTIEAEDIVLDVARGPGAEIRKLESLLPRVAEDLSEAAYCDYLKAAERQYFLAALEATHDNAIDAGARVGFARSTIFNKLAALGIPRRGRGAKSDETNEPPTAASTGALAATAALRTEIDRPDGPRMDLQDGGAQ